MTRPTDRSPQETGPVIAAYMILFVAIGMMVLPTLIGLWLGNGPLFRALP